MTNNEPETLCIAWLSSCQQFTFTKSIAYLTKHIDEDGEFTEDFNVNVKPIVGAVAVKYKNNTFSVFIGIAMGQKEDKDIAYIKSMGQRTTEQIARGIFPQFADMAYHS